MGAIMHADACFITVYLISHGVNNIVPLITTSRDTEVICDRARLHSITFNQRNPTYLLTALSRNGIVPINYITGANNCQYNRRARVITPMMLQIPIACIADAHRSLYSVISACMISTLAKIPASLRPENYLVQRNLYSIVTIVANESSR